ncbi:MAG TPA: alpha/beta fold hydrolase [Pirellulales bacterium]|nr:alpha/beta fold hydrolase [Pirellulales bacterium]
MDRRLLARQGILRGFVSRPAIHPARYLFPIALCAALATGCASPKWVVVRDAPRNPLTERLKLLSSGGPRPTQRTLMFLRRYDLQGHVHDNPVELVHQVQGVIDKDPSPEALAAAAELAYIGGVKSQALMQTPQAFNLYCASVAYSYAYLFNPAFTLSANPYDPQFRGACDLYNASLEAALRVVNKQGNLRPGQTFSVELKGQQYDIAIQPRNVPWPAGDIKQFEFVSDYQINGLKNVFHTYGLGVPLIAVRRDHPVDDPVEKHYAPGLSFPVTAFLRCLPDDSALATTNTTADGKRHHQAVLELYDPLQSTDIALDDRHVPLESDITTPLAYSLNDPSFAALDQPTTGFLHPKEIKELAGIYMLEPYQPGKIPVLMIHGLWSSPITWMEMFNDLRGDPDLRSQYQFWFYLYPTGQPFWHSASQLREALADLRNTFDPAHQEAALDQMVLVGHSMGGLLANMQVVNSRDDFWHIVSDNPFQLVKADNNTRAGLDRTFYFAANPSVRTIITIGTPHRGSYFANDVTRYLSEKLVSLPETMTARLAKLRLDNPGFFRNTEMITPETSLDSLSPSAPILPVLLAAQRPPWIKYHNIVGRLPASDWQVKLFGDGDGVVPYESAHLADVDSEIEVPAEHDEVHRHPQTILQVHNILAEHLREVKEGYPEVETTQRATTTAR